MPAVAILPFAMSCGTRRLTVSTGTAKPMPEKAPLGLKIAVLTPTSRPEESSRGPPELPGIDGGVGLNHVTDAPAVRRA
jgi:hypothetical protein